jgi:hypothetical protein
MKPDALISGVCVGLGDWVNLAGDVYVVALVGEGKVALIDFLDGGYWSEPTEWCGDPPHGGTPLANFMVRQSHHPVIVRRKGGGKHG